MFVFSPIFRIYVVTFLPFKVQIIDIKRFTNTMIVSTFGCMVLVHHFDTVAGSLPNCSASHLLVRFFSAKTTFSLFISLFISVYNCLIMQK